MLKVTEVEVNAAEKLVLSVYHKRQVDGHVNPYGVLVQNGEGTMNADLVGWYIVPQGVRLDGHILYTRGETWGGKTYEEAVELAKACANDQSAIDRWVNEPFGGWWSQ